MTPLGESFVTGVSRIVDIETRHFIEADNRIELFMPEQRADCIRELMHSLMIGEPADGHMLEVQPRRHGAIPVGRIDRDVVSAMYESLRDVEEITLEAAEREILENAECQTHGFLVLGMEKTYAGRKLELSISKAGAI